MFLAIDIGNTHVVCAIHNSKKWVHILRIKSNLNFWQRLESIKTYSISSVAISSVVPNLTKIYFEAVRNVFHIDSFIITHNNSGINIQVEAPEEVGSERI